MPSSAARAATALERRPESSASPTPLFASILMPWPSKEWKALISSPARPYQSLPSVSTPSTSKIMSLTRRARSSASGDANCMPGLEDFGAEKVVHVERTDQCAVFVDHQDLVDLVLFHQMHRFRGEHCAANGLRAWRHDFVDLERVQVGALLQGAAQVAVGEYTLDGAILVEHRRHAHFAARHLQD